MNPNVAAASNYRWIVALGSNLGDGRQNLRAARKELAALGEITAASAIYETAPMYDEDQPRFYNAVIQLETPLDGPTLLQRMQQIEAQNGRIRSTDRRYGPRAIDLDIVAGYEGETHTVLITPTLAIPHPRMHERVFVLVPMRDIVAQWRHPQLGETLEDLIQKAGVDDSLRMVVESEQWA